jgi:uncharacterized protein YlxW (UPF0749 family)
MGDGRIGRLLWPSRGQRAWGWRLAAPIAFGCAGLLAATSAINAKGTDLRGGRHDSLIEVVSTERAKVQAQLAQVKALQAQVAALSQSINGDRIRNLHAQLAQLEVPAGTDPNVLLVHQQDIQAVANALWSGGAEGISLQGNRIVSTTGIKCVGNTVVLQGVPYAPPYRIVAVGNVDAMYEALLASPEVRNYRDYVPPPYNLGWSIRTSAELSVPAYTGPVSAEFAEPVLP